MTLKELSQLYHLNREIEMDQTRLLSLDAEIKQDEEQLAFLEMQVASPSTPNYDGMPKSPSFGNKLEGQVARLCDLKDLIQCKKALRSDCAMAIQAKQILCLTERNRLERYIATLPDSLLRMAFTYRFINGLPWGQVAESISYKATEDGVKKMCYRYLEEHKDDK